LTKTDWLLPSVVALLVCLGPAARADQRGHHKGKVMLARAAAQDDQAKPESTGEEKGEAKAGRADVAYTHVDYSESHLEGNWYRPLCDYSWTRNLLQTPEERMAPNRSLEFYCVPVTTHLYYPMLYPYEPHAGALYVVNPYGQ